MSDEEKQRWKRGVEIGSPKRKKKKKRTVCEGEHEPEIEQECMGSATLEEGVMEEAKEEVVVEELPIELVTKYKAGLDTN